MATIKSFRDLIIWQVGINLSVEIACFSQTLPSTQQYGLAEQMRRSSASVPSNIAEGYGRGSAKEFAQFLRVARGSLNELETQLELCTQLGYADVDTLQVLMNTCVHLRVMIVRYMRSMKQTPKTEDQKPENGERRTENGEQRT
jgi:four helix bundle protein